MRNIPINYISFNEPYENLIMKITYIYLYTYISNSTEARKKYNYTEHPVYNITLLIC